jgi:hypothetical protein
MYLPIEGGSVEVIQGFVCQLPPVGYGKNRLTGELEHIGVVKSALRAEDQVWKRIQLPADWDKRRAAEQKMQILDPEYFDQELEKIRERFWQHRLCGIWVYINGKPTYLTGSYFKYLNCCPIDVGYPAYRDTDRRFYYVWEYCVEDERCAGLVDIERRRMGKCLGKDTPIRMYDGSVKMVQDIREGDLVMGNDAAPRRAFGIITGREQMYKIVPHKGQPFTCNESHILSLKYNKDDKHSTYGWLPGSIVNISVKDYLNLKWEKNHLVLYRTGWGEHFKANQHFIPPYILGVFLGDGVAVNGHLSNPDPEIIEAYNEYVAPLGLTLKSNNGLDHRVVNAGIGLKRNKYRNALAQMGLLNNKHIPNDYLIDSEANRLELLAGLLDTDGYLNRGPKTNLPISFEITQKSEVLATQITDLARSLGFYVNQTRKIATMVRKDGTIYRCPVYRIYISGAIERIPCKVARRKAEPVKRRVNVLNTGFKVECIGEGEYYGFAVDGNHLFLLADGLVTHNTFKSGSILLDRASLYRSHHGGIQSKTGEDAKNVFKKTVVTFFKKIPDFFRPIYDKSKGITPTSELRFFQTTLKGRNAEKIIGGEELESWIDYGTSEPFYYDGSKLNTYVCDEFAKTMDCNVWDRWNVVRFCLDQDGQWVGKALFTSTVEEMENGGENGRKVWDASNQDKRNANGRTVSGMYRFFLPAYETLFFDKYGMPEIDKAKDFLLKERAGLAHDPRALSSIIRKNPFTIDEAFRIDGDRCLYDAMKLNLQLDSLSYKQNLTTRGNFVWENGEPFTKVKFEKAHNGRWEVASLIENYDHANKVVNRNGRYFPNNNFAYTIGCDPFKYDATKDNRRSDCAAFVYKKYDAMSPNSIYNDAFVCYYKHRAQTTAMQYEDILKMAWYYGCQVLFERNINNWHDYFHAKSCEGFLMKLPGETEYGIYTDGHKTVHQMLADYTEAYINEHIEKVFFKDLLEEWLLFDVGATTKFDSAMAAGFSLIAARDKAYQRRIEDTKDVSNYFKLRKATA